MTIRVHLHRILISLLFTLAAGCAQPVVQADAEQRACLRFFAQLDRSIEQAGARDGQHFLVHSGRWLRADRYLASLAREQPARRELLKRMADLARSDYGIELSKVGWSPEHVDQVLLRIGECQATLLPGLPADTLEKLDSREEYSVVQRVLGLYPLTRWPVLAGVNGLHEQVTSTFARERAELPLTGQLQRWTPARTCVARMAEFHTHAPVIEVDVAGRDDRIGVPGRDPTGELVFEPDTPVLFVHTARTRFGGHSLRQLVYVFWFPARTPEGSIDLLAGKLDGLTWRVTLAPDGRPLIYDVMHNCGCYHMFFPTSRLVQRQGPLKGEPPLIPATVSGDLSHGRVHLRLAAGTHYVQQVWREPDTGPGKVQPRTYTFRHYDELRRRGLFPYDGIIAESRRGEWITLWPMGVPAPGAMRQWGRHATAFIGRRYFDEPFLFERYFSYTTDPQVTP